MSTYQFSFPLTPSEQALIDRVLSDHQRGVYPTSDEVITISLASNDAIVKALALDVIEILHANGDGGNVLKVVSNLLKSTMHGLIRQLMHKLSRTEMDALVLYLRHRQIQVNGEERFGFDLPDALGASMMAIFADIDAQRFDGVRERLTKDMLTFVDLAMVRFFDELMIALDLGFVMKKVVSVGRATVSKGSHSATSKLFMSMSDVELIAASQHYRTLFTRN